MSEANANTSVGTATVMFTDLVGSTALRSRVGEDVADVLRAAHDEVVNAAISDNGGRVVKHLGDGMMATFASAAGAVASAVAMMQELDLRNRRSDAERLEIRVGISIGDVTWDGDDCFGLPVVEAQRLEASSDPSTIRCAEMVMLMARGRGGHEFEPIGDLELKGLAEPLAACEVQWSPIADAPRSTVELGLPPVFAHGTGLPFAGRDEVFEQLVDTWKRCIAGGFEVVLLSGEPGIGKTRLAQELAVRVQGGDGIVLGGRSDEDVTVPYQAFGAALDWFVRQTPADQVLQTLGEFPGDLVRLVPELGRLVVDLPPALHDEPDVERLRLFRAVDSWLSVGGLDRPRLLVLDDLHWADKPTLLLLRHLISNPPAGLMVLCTYRDTDVDRTHPLSSMLADFRRMPAVARIALDGLGDEGVRELLVRTGGNELDEQGLAFAEIVQRETSGNPFFLGEVLRHLAETGALYQRDGRWVSDQRPEDAGIPEGIREVVGRRLSRLGDDVESVLRSAAVIGYEFDVDLLADVVGRDPDEVLDVLDVASSANLVIELGVDRHRFAHALVRETLHEELSSSRRARQHRKVAEALEARHAGDIDTVITELATHWAEASAGGDPTRAIELAVRAGDLAADRGAAENATSWFERALELMEDEDLSFEMRRRTLVRLAESQVALGLGPEGRVNAHAAARAAVAAGDVATACDAIGVTPRMSFDSSDPEDPERVELLLEILKFADLTTRQRAGLLGALATEYIFDRNIAGRATALAEMEALAAELPLIDQQGLRNAGTGVYRGAAAGIDAKRERLDQLGRFIELETRPSLRIGLQIGQWFAANGCGDRDIMDEALPALETAAAARVNRMESFALVPVTMDLTMAGLLDEADRRRSDMIAAFEALQAPEMFVYSFTTGMALERERGTVESLMEVVEMFEIGHVAGAGHAAAAFVRMATGDIEAVDRALELISAEELSDDAGYPVVVALWSELVAARRAESACRRFIDELTPLSATQIATGGIHLGAADRLLALLYDAVDDRASADELFASAVEQHRALRSPPWVVRTELDWATSLLARGDETGALAHLDAARTAIGSLILPDSQRRLDELTDQLAHS
ncbi:MAG TPA: AAA family ATPase [Ilumatobacteraceae bacterium]|nr:AAA family ATPase [Ilumatobacteraceae bacterium]